MIVVLWCMTRLAFYKAPHSKSMAFTSAFFCKMTLQHLRQVWDKLYCDEKHHFEQEMNLLNAAKQRFSHVS